jgi:hypothetical protein
MALAMGFAKQGQGQSSPSFGKRPTIPGGAMTSAAEVGRPLYISWINLAHANRVVSRRCRATRA